MSTGQLHPRDWAMLCLFYCQELVLDSATPGQVAKERLQRNAKLLREACEVWCSYCGWNVQELTHESWRKFPDSAARAKAEQDKGKRKKKV